MDLLFLFVFYPVTFTLMLLQPWHLARLSTFFLTLVVSALFFG